MYNSQHVQLHLGDSEVLCKSFLFLPMVSEWAGGGKNLSGLYLRNRRKLILSRDIG